MAAFGDEVMGDRNAAVAFYNQACVAINDTTNPDRLRHAYSLFASACLTDPTWGEAHYQAGCCNSDMDQHHAAIACWSRALQCQLDPLTRAKALGNMGWRLHSIGKTHVARKLMKESLEIEPKKLRINWSNLSCIYQVLGLADETLRCAKTAYDLDPHDPTIEVALAFAHLFSRNTLAEGFAHFEARFAYKLKSYTSFPYPRWSGEEDVTLFLDSDQGLGDTISFARFVPLAAKRCKYIHMLVQAELVRLFQYAFVAIPNINIIPKPAHFQPADYWTTFVSLPYALHLDDETIKNMSAISFPKFNTPVNWRVPDRKLHVGIAWKGSALNNINEHRSIPIQMFYDLFEVPGVQLYSLQKDAANQEAWNSGGGPLIVDLTRYINDVTDTVALLSKLDLVITCESALGHIAGMCRKECWIPYSRLGLDYRIGMMGDDVIWYPKHRIFKQGEDRDWNPVFQHIKTALREKLSNAGEPQLPG